MRKVKVYIDGKHDYIYYVDEFETIEKIIKDKCSICRFGDGEFKLAVGDDQKCCQMKDKKLQKRLCEILKSTHKNILVGLPNIYYDFKNKPPFPGYEWKTYRSKKYIQLLKGNNTYYSTWISRGDNAPKIMCHKYWNRIKDIWKNRNIVFVIGKADISKLSLFDNCNIIDYVYGLERDSFSKYDTILKNCLKYNKDTLFIIALGPTATVLAYDLGLKDYQAIDIGHIGMFYGGFLKGHWKGKEYNTLFKKKSTKKL